MDKIFRSLSGNVSLDRIDSEGAFEGEDYMKLDFCINGIQYRVSAETYTVGYARATVPEDPAHTLEILKTVLDGIQ